MVYFVAKTLGFIPEEWKKDGTYSDAAWPASAVILTEKEASEFWKTQPPAGKTLGEKNGRPAWVNIPEMATRTSSDVENLRLCAYSNVITGSDRLFAEASRMQIMGEEGSSAVKDKAIARYKEIQAQYPWPPK